MASGRSMAPRRPAKDSIRSVSQKDRRTALQRLRIAKRNDGGHQPRVARSQHELEPNSAHAVGGSTDLFVQRRRERPRITHSAPPSVERVQMESQIGDRFSEDSSSSDYGMRTSPSSSTPARSQSLRPRLAISEPKTADRSSRVSFRDERTRLEGARWMAADFAGLEPTRSRSKRMEEMPILAPLPDRWPSLPDEPAVPNDDVSSALRAWERRSRLDREQQGK